MMLPRPAENNPVDSSCHSRPLCLHQAQASTNPPLWPPSRVRTQVDNEDMVFTLEAIVQKFGEEIGPWAIDLANNLTQAFWKYTKQGEDEEDEDDTGEGSLEAVAAVVQGLCLRRVHGKSLPGATTTTTHVRARFPGPRFAAALAAFGCLKALNTLLDSCSGLPRLYPGLENICWPIMQVRRTVGVGAGVCLLLWGRG